MKKVYQYTNYRYLLKDFYEQKKATGGFTYRDFSQATGMNSSSWLLHLIRGTKNLSRETADRVARIIGLNSSETGFFHLLVKFTQAKSSEEKDRIYVEMIKYKKKLKIFKITEKYYDYYKKWYHPVIRSLVSKVDFGDDYLILAKNLVPAITPAEAKSSVKLLSKLGLINKGPDGKWAQTNAVISTGDEVASLNVVNYHKQVTRLAGDVFDNIPKEKRDISALTLGVNGQDAKRIKERLQAFRKEIMEIAQASENADRVYQLNFHFFPVSKWKESDDEQE